MPDRFIDGGLNKHVIPAGSVPQEKLTVPTYSGFGVAVTTKFADCPGCSVALIGLADKAYAGRSAFTFCARVATVWPIRLSSPEKIADTTCAPIANKDVY